MQGLSTLVWSLPCSDARAIMWGKRSHYNTTHLIQDILCQSEEGLLDVDVGFCTGLEKPDTMLCSNLKGERMSNKH